MDIRGFFGGKASAKAPAPSPKKGSPGEQKENKSGAKGETNVEKVEKVEKVAKVGASPKSVTESSSSKSSTSSKAGSGKVLFEKESVSAASGAIPANLTAQITWKNSEPIPYAAVVDTFEKVSKVSGRLEKESLFKKLFQSVILTTPQELEAVVYLVANEVAPSYEGLELGIGDSLLVKAVCEATGRNKSAVDEDYQREGDLGTVALLSRSKQSTLSFAAKPKPLLAKHVLEQFRLITQTKGDKSQSRKIAILKGLMIKCVGEEAKYIVRAMQGKLRIGSAKSTYLVSLAHAFAETMPHAVKTIMQNDEKQDSVGDQPVPQPETSMLKESTVGTIEASAGASGEGEMDVAVAADGSEEAKETEDEKVAREQKEGEEGERIALTLQGAEEARTDWHTVVVKQPEEAVTLQKALAGEDYGINTDGSVNGDDKEGSSSSSTSAVSKLVKMTITKEDKAELAVIAVKRAFCNCPSLTVLVNSLLTTPLYGLWKKCKLVTGMPIEPMLAKPTKKIQEVMDRLQGLAFTMEYKYDGERAQVHLLEDGSVKIFSRNSLDDTEKYPELASTMHNAKHGFVTSCIVDAEVVAWDREKDVLLPFQVLSTRKRKVEEADTEVQPVKVVLEAFDMLYLNGKSLLQESLRTRRGFLRRAMKNVRGVFHFASGLDHVENGETSGIETFLQEACTACCEGLMVKTLDDNATYEPSKRSLNWLKLKKDYIEGMGVCDSVDLTVIGAYYGKGKRTNVFGAYLMACYDPEREEFQSVCKVGTGFSDENLQKLTTQQQEYLLETSKKPMHYNVGDTLTPDVWFQSKTVWELQAADLSKSSVHKGAMGLVDDGSRGIGLRFPRFIRERPDKRPEAGTSAQQVADMYRSQDMHGVAGDAPKDAYDSDEDGI